MAKKKNSKQEKSKKTTPAGKTAASKSESAAKRGTQQPKAGSKGVQPAPVAQRERASTPQRSQGLKSNTAVNALSKQAARQPGASMEQEQQERLSIFRRLIEILKRIIGYKKGERNEFRYNLDTEHPNFIFEQHGKKYRAIGVTHENETFGKPNMPLEENPDPTDKDNSFVRNGIIKQKGGMGKKRMTDLKFSEKDTPKVKSKIRHYKKTRKIEESKRKKAEKRKREGAENEKSK